jgi:hypothetical protein
MEGGEECRTGEQNIKNKISGEGAGNYRSIRTEMRRNKNKMV